jgi:myo-inositol catabolism protein IolS
MLKNLGNTDIKITSIIMGCWQIGGMPHWQNIEDSVSIKAILMSLDAGINTFDTAPGYGNGHSERLLGATLKPYRAKATIATKVFADKLAYGQVIESCENSLKNLQTDYIDLFQIHFPAGSFGSPFTPIEETMDAFLSLKKDGKIRAIGVSNFSLPQLQEVCKHAQIASVQPPFSLFWRKSFDEIRDYCEKSEISILAYSPLAQGLLTGKFDRNYHFPENEIRIKQVLYETEHYARVQDALDELRQLAINNAMSLTELSLSWVISQPKVSAIVGIRTPPQAENNAKAMKLPLSQQDLKKMDEIGRKVTQHLDEYPFMWNF